jgi:hypothetical protein
MKALILTSFLSRSAASLPLASDTTSRSNFSSAASLVVFLALFFANFVVSWIAVIFVMGGTLKDAQGRQHQLDIERSGRRAMNETAARLRG